MKNRFKDSFEEIFKRVMDLDSVSDDMEMNNIAEWDSLRQVQLIAELEEKLNLDFDFEDIISMTSIKKIDNVLCKF